MANDGSMASLVEGWLVTKLRALACFADRDVEHFPGAGKAEGQKILEELMSGRSSPAVFVMFEGDRPVRLEEGDQAYEPTYSIYIIVQSHRPGMSRIGEVVGEVTVSGTNGYRDLIRNALHDEYPNLGANGFYTERAEFRGVQIVLQRSDAFILRAEVIVRETPTG